MSDNKFPNIVCGDKYQRPNGEVCNVFGSATHKKTGELLVIFANGVDEVWAVDAIDFFAVTGDGIYNYLKID